MDTSETYIRMSHQAFPEPTIMPHPPLNKVQVVSQLEAKPRSEHVEIPGTIASIFVDCMGDFWADYKGLFIPLYRQDQLQPLALNDMPIKDIRYLLLVFTDWVGYVEDKTLSMEQLWLAFVMHSLYHKKWNGTDWKLDIEM